jgi:hypothetical protein
LEALWVIVVVVVFVVAVWQLMPRKMPAQTPGITVMVSSGGRSSSDDRPTADTGALAPAGESAWVLNPKAPLPLTVVGASREIAEQLRVLLHTPGTWSVKQPEVTYLIARHNLRFKEIDEFVAQPRPRFEAEVERQKKASTEWAGASELDRDDLLAEFQEKAIESLGLNHNAFNLELLMTGELKHVEDDDKLLDRFAGDSALYSLYLGQIGRGVVTIGAADYFREAWEKLVAKGLARRGRDIPMPLLLEELRVKDLNEIIAGPKAIGRKAKAIEAALALPDLDARLERKIAYREKFLAIPPEGLDVAAIADAFAYADAIARLALITCYTGVRTLLAIEERKEGGYNAYEITNFEDDPAPACAQRYLKQYDRLPAKRPPFHVGCNCTLECTYKD